MSNYFFLYCTLLGSKEQLAHCHQADSLSDLLLKIKVLWSCTQLDDNELLAEINLLNQIPVSDTTALAGNWLPYRYLPSRQQVNWLVPVGHAIEPFHDDYISRCRQQLFNQIIQPCSSLEFATQQGEQLINVQPTGFIFHLSRCGSTLISGCLSELESTCVFSEAPLLTELLLDSQLSTEMQQKHLQAFINLQAAAFPDRPQVIIKWNAWDIFRWELIRTLYPQVPAIFLARDPVEILASHQRMAGRHMAGDPRLADFHPVFALQESSLFNNRLAVLHRLLTVLWSKVSEKHIYPIDYSQLSTATIGDISHFLHCDIDDLAFLKIQERMKFHSKTPGQIFVMDNATKQDFFERETQAFIRAQLGFIYNQFLMLAFKSRKAVINAR